MVAMNEAWAGTDESPPGSMGQELVLIDKARMALAEANTLDAVTEIRDQAAAVAQYVKRRDGAEEAAKYAREIRLRAERRIGELTREMPKEKAGRPKNESNRGPISKGPSKSRKADALKDVGLSKQEASRCESIAAIPDEVFEEAVSAPDASTAKLAKLGRGYATKKTTKRKPRPFDAVGRALALRDYIIKFVDDWPESESLSPVVATLNQMARQVERIFEKEEPR